MTDYGTFEGFRNSHSCVRVSSIEELEQVRNVITLYEPDAGLRYCSDADFQEGFTDLGFDGVQWVMWKRRASQYYISFGEWMERIVDWPEDMSRIDVINMDLNEVL